MESRTKNTKDMRVRADRRGHFAERIACWWLRLAGYQIVARRWRAVTGEIDLIAKRRRLLVFVEVKYRFDSQHIAAPTPRQCQRHQINSLFIPRQIYSFFKLPMPV
ncbi:MAG: YraN family protein [Alphaproteobacteria bacterium]